MLCKCLLNEGKKCQASGQIKPPCIWPPVGRRPSGLLTELTAYCGHGIRSLPGHCHPPWTQVPVLLLPRAASDEAVCSLTIVCGRIWLCLSTALGVFLLLDTHGSVSSLCCHGQKWDGLMERRTPLCLQLPLMVISLGTFYSSLLPSPFILRRVPQRCSSVHSTPLPFLERSLSSH